VYLAGVAVALYVRPASMFAHGGAVREFGLTPGRTVLPFWLFVLLWALLSYGAALVVVTTGAALALGSA
jgi:hypothetical protein